VFSDLIRYQQTGKRGNPTLTNRENKKKNTKTKTKEWFEKQLQSHACSRTFYSNMYGIDQLPYHPH
jgi:hypothetical protein